MPNLVGIGLSQVPTNSMLGGLAYQDPEHASIKNLDLKNLSQINSEIADTAVDVFVYDTRKDSDGGAWRKRTQNTSWYNETLNTATRGSRKEFPSVAVIVADVSTDKVTIYDGDDPDLPMWMVFSGSNPRGILSWPTTNLNSIKVAALNGILATATNDGGHLFKFIEDFVEINYGSTNYPITTSRTIGGRNDTAAYVSGGGATRTNVVLTYNQNDVAMTVLPNAPIDDATGLPVPTIAVATVGGVSVLKDDGTVVDITSAQGGNYNQSKAITITEENYLWWLGDYNAGSAYVRDSYAVSLDNFPSSDFTWNNVNDNLSDGKYYALTTAGESGEIKIGPVNTWAWNHQERNALGGPAGLAIHKPNIGTETNSLIAAITSDYNTGWMHGDIKGAFLSDTDTTNATDSQKVNWNTGSDVSGSYGGTTAASVTVVSNTTITITASSGGYAYYSVGFTPVSGKKYAAVLTGSNHSGAGPYGLSTGGGFSLNMRRSSNGTVGPEIMTSAGSVIPIFVGTSVTVTVALTIYELAEEDRSVNDNGLEVHGTITKTPVATGAELVAYSGFSASNYLKQPYNSGLDFGTGDFSIMFWFKTPTGSVPTECFLHRGDGGTGTWGSGKIIQIEFNSTNLAAFLAESAFSSYDTITVTGTKAATGQWMHYALVRSGTSVRAYLNGEVNGTATSSRDLSNTSASTWIGERPNSSRPATTSSLALFRMSALAPSAEQIKKMYEDEKFLFQENAKATLYGSSDAVTALAYDDTTNLLHVGTSAGRSEFQGLRRINNTTDAVTTAISASNGLVAEQ